MALRTLIGLYRGKTKSGKDVLRADLQKTLILRDDDGNERVYLKGTFVQLLKNDNPKSDKSPHYHLLAAVPDDEQTYPSQQMVNHPQAEPITRQQSPPPPASQDVGPTAAQQQRAREWHQENEPHEIPF